MDETKQRILDAARQLVVLDEQQLERAQRSGELEKTAAQLIANYCQIGPVQRGKEDFSGAIDGLGYKASMDDPTKPPLDLVPPTLARGIARVLGKGAKKYSRGNWMRGMSFSEVIAAAERHLLAIKQGEDVDPDSGELHIYHLGCELAFLSWFQDGPRSAEYARFDDRLFRHG